MKTQHTVAERFWSLAATDEYNVEGASPEEIVRHVLAILDALDRGEGNAPAPKESTAFLELLRAAEEQGAKSYAAPERVGGEQLDERSLVFSVGVLLFERLTGRHPFGAEGNEPRRLARMSRGEFGSGVNYFPQVPGTLRTILMRAMGPFPEERFASIDELRAQLEAFARHQVKEPPHPQLPDTKKRRPGFDRAPTAPGDMSKRVKKEVEIAAAKRREEAGITEATAEIKPRTPTPIPEPRRPASRTPVAYLVAGAAVGGLAVYLLVPRGGDSPKSAPVASVSPSPSPSASPAPTPAQPAPTPTPSPAPATPSPPTPPPPTPHPALPPPGGGFDATAAGQATAELGRSCFPDTEMGKGRQYGLSIVYAADGHISTLYFAPGNEEVSLIEKRCLAKAMKGTTPSGAPGKSVMGEYMIRLRPDGMHVKLKKLE